MLKFSKEKQTGRKPIDKGHKTSLNIKESDLQSQCEEYLQYHPDITAVRIPDSAYRAIFANSSIQPHIKRQISSFLKGIPDLILLRSCDNGENRALCIELKVGDNKLSQGQKHFAEKVNVHVIRRLEDFVKLIEEWK